MSKLNIEIGDSINETSIFIDDEKIGFVQEVLLHLDSSCINHIELSVKCIGSNAADKFRSLTCNGVHYCTVIQDESISDSDLKLILEQPILETSKE
jgi:hypothetical protein